MYKIQITNFSLTDTIKQVKTQSHQVGEDVFVHLIDTGFNNKNKDKVPLKRNRKMWAHDMTSQFHRKKTMNGP